MFEKFLTENV